MKLYIRKIFECGWQSIISTSFIYVLVVIFKQKYFGEKKKKTENGKITEPFRSNRNMFFLGVIQKFCSTNFEKKKNKGKNFSKKKKFKKIIFFSNVCSKE